MNKSILKFGKLLLAFLFIMIALVCLLFGYTDKSVSELKIKYANESSQFLELGGMKIHYRDEGVKTDSIPIVLIHGTGSSLQTYDAWTEELKKDFRVIRMDLPAFGLTGPFPDRSYSIEKYVQFMDRFLSGIDVEKCYLAGNSLGGRIAWNFSVDHPERVEKLILIDASGYPTESKSIPIAFRIAAIPVLNKLLTFITPRFMAKSSVESVYADKSKVDEELVNRYFDLTLRAGNRQGLVDRVTMPLKEKEHLRIKQIKTPTLILWGDQDLLVPVKFAHRFQNDLMNDTLVVLKNVGHVPMEESPKKSLIPVLDFLKKF